MGDFFAPKRKDVFEKFRRRLEHYRHHHSQTSDRYVGARPSIYEQQKQDTLLLHQRWLESKAKKAAKHSKTTRDTNNTQSDHRNLVVTKLKRKIDSVSAEVNTTSTSTTGATNTAAETVFRFEDKDLQSSSAKNSKNGQAGGGKHATGLPSLSVQIVQQISAHPQQDAAQTIHTNVTVSSHYSADSPSTSHSVHTSVQCKQEPTEDSARSSATNTAADIDSTPVPDIGIGLDDVDELQNILDSIEKDDDIESSLLKDLNEFNEIYDKVQRDSESDECSGMYAPLSCSSPGLLKGVFPSLGHLSAMFDSGQSMSVPAVNNHSLPVPPTIPEPTGPAAETLKQMAAQHQNQHIPGYPLKGLDHFPDGLRNGGFQPNYSQIYLSVPSVTTAYPFNHSSNHHLNDSSQLAPEMAAAMAYNGTKPLTHFPSEQSQQHNSTSSLAQLQNQVQSHFKPPTLNSHQMQVTQTQHMQLSHGGHSMQLSQSQQVQMQSSPQQLSLSQQQGFTMGQQQAISEQIKVQMMEKFRMEQQQQSRMPQHYMGRPPPEYAVHHGARHQGPYSTLAGNQNPLQTMQNMINQTSAYGTVKSEVAGSSSPGQTNMMPSHISVMQQQTTSTSLATDGSHMGNLPQSSQGIRPGFHPQSQPPAYSVVESSTRAQSTSPYTSAIMRNQRPPNVNVGPDGLNISQPRGHVDWSRANMGQPSHAAMRPGLARNSPDTHGLPQSAAMPAHVIQYQQQRPLHYTANPATGGMTAAVVGLQPQLGRQAIPGQVRGGPSVNPNSSQMMMSMQMSQQMSMHSSSPSYMGETSTNVATLPSMGYSMGGPSTGTTLSGGGNSSMQTAAFPGQPASTTASQEEFLHFLDNPLTTEPMFDSIQNTTEDFSLFEDILNGK